MQRWDAATSTPVGREAEGDATAYSPDGKFPAVVASLKRYDAESGKPVGKPIRLDSRESVQGLSDARTGDAIGTPLSHDVHEAAYSPDGKRIATASDDNSACSWDTATGTALGTLSDRAGSVRSAAWSPDGRSLITVGSGGIRLWGGESVVGVGEINVNFPGIVSSDAATFSSDGRRIVATAGGEAWQLDFDPPDSPPPAWLDRLLQVARGYRFNDRGELEACRSPTASPCALPSPPNSRPSPPNPRRIGCPWPAGS